MSEATQSQTSSSANPAAGWYPDPQGGQGLRWWDGSAWTEHTHEGTPAAGGAAAASTGASPASTTPAATATESKPAPDGKKRVNFINDNALAILIGLLVILAVVVVLNVL